MQNVMQRGAAWLGGRLKTLAGRRVTVDQGPWTFDVTATVVMQEYDVVDSEGFTTKEVRYDWMILAAELPENFEFLAGPIIRETVGLTVHRYEGMPIGNKPTAEWLDSSRVMVVVHTKRIGTNL